MSKTRDAGTAAPRGMPTNWGELTAMHPLRPIRDRTDLGNATEIIDRMAGHRLNRDQEDYLDSLSTLVEAYEREHDPVEADVRGTAALAALVEEHGMTAADLARLLGVHRSAGSKILRGQRSLTARHVRTLSEHFRVDAGALLG